MIVNLPRCWDEDVGEEEPDCGVTSEVVDVMVVDGVEDDRIPTSSRYVRLLDLELGEKMLRSTEAIERDWRGMVDGGEGST